MIRHQGTYETSLRENMRGGKGAVRVETLWSSAELKEKTRLFARLTLPAGSSIGFHEHVAEAEVFVVVRGHAQVTEAEGQPPTAVGPGDTILTGDGAGHAVESLGPDPLELVAVIVKF